MRATTWRMTLLVATAVAAGCGTNPVSSGALQVRVTLAPQLRSACARVIVEGAGQSLQTKPMLLAGQKEVRVGVLRDVLPAAVTVRAVGYSDDDCTQATSPAETSATVAVEFSTAIKLVTLTLAPATAADGGVDADGDGVPLPADCDDDNRDIFPGAVEVCSDGVDNDCDTLRDCEQASCGAMACTAGPGAVCAGGTCAETNCTDGVDNDGDNAIDCADTNCDGAACGTGGTCTGDICRSPTETGLCADGVDNDGDLAIDCADSDCAQGATCSDFNGCTENDACGAAGVGCVSGAPKACTTPPNTACFSAAGSCLPDAGGACDYAVLGGASCNDGRVCTSTDLCGADGGCRGSPVVCNTPPGACFTSPGVCSEAAAGCTYSPLIASSVCDDGNTCTVGDSCDGDGGCQGTTVNCTPPTECQAFAGTCQADAGCNFTNRTGLPCDGGTCTAGGVCMTGPPVFSYPPSNFTEGQLPASAGDWTVNCNVQLNTGAGTAPGVTWSGSCAPAATPAIVMVGGAPAVLLFFDSMTINNSRTLRVFGDRPLILAVRNNVTITGTLDVSSTITTSGPGAGVGCGASNGASGTSGGGSAGGGGAGGGALGLDGADGADGQNGGVKGAKGTTRGTPELTPLLGGCRGGIGGKGSPTNGGAPGLGGGALQVSAGGTVTASGDLNASGGGGQGGANSTSTGGGGGGSGGAILLEGTTLTLSGYVTANGGGGGEGSSASGTGDDGTDGRSNSMDAAAGGGNNTCGGDGGNGGARNGGGAQPGEAATCSSTAVPAGGGGGGGSAGRIRLNATTACAIANNRVSPPATSNRAGANGCP